jgi:Tfp pilus assembly protein PilN
LLEKPETTRLSRSVLWLVVLSLSIMFLPIYLVSTAIKDRNQSLEDELVLLQITLTGGPSIDPEEEALRETLTYVRDQLREVEPVHPTLIAGHVDWPAVMSTLANFDPTQMALTSLAQTENRIVLDGQANDETVVVAYTRMLEQSNQFSRVVVQSINLILLPTATPTATPTPTVTPTATPTPLPAATGSPTSTTLLLPPPPTQAVASSPAMPVSSETPTISRVRTRYVEFVILLELKAASTP